MSTLNWNVSGDPKADQPVLITDNPPGGTSLAAHFEGVTGHLPNRLVVTCPDDLSGGSTLYYQNRTKRIRVILPPGAGSWEAGDPPCRPPEVTDPDQMTLHYASPLARLQPDGVQLLVNGKRWTWAMMTGFCDYALWLAGRKDDLHAVWQQAKDLGANGRRVLGQMHFITRLYPQDHPNYYAELQPFAADAATFGLRLHFDVFADNQEIHLGEAHWQQVRAQLEPVESVLIGAGNEWPKNGFDPFALSQPMVIASQGSHLGDTAPPMPGWGIRMWHGRRDYPKVFMAFDDAVYVGRGLDENAHQYAPVAPVVHDEPIGFAEVEIPQRRSTDPVLAQCIMLSGRAYGAGATYHSEDGIYSRLLGPVQQTCARAFFDVQG